jgi:hypothetical protein
MNIKKIISLTLMSFFLLNSSYAQKNDHVISDNFGDWKVRHYFDRESLEHRFSDAKSMIVLDDGREMEFQINRRSDNWIAYIVDGWWDNVTITVDDKRFSESQSSMHIFYGSDNINDLLNAIASTKDEIRIELTNGSRKLVGNISSEGSNSALRWIRVIK